jgi:hypothetical protein
MRKKPRSLIKREDGIDFTGTTSFVNTLRNRKTMLRNIKCISSDSSQSNLVLY